MRRQLEGGGEVKGVLFLKMKHLTLCLYPVWKDPVERKEKYIKDSGDNAIARGKSLSREKGMDPVRKEVWSLIK